MTSFADHMAALVDPAVREVLGQPDIVYQPGTGDPVTVDGVFDAVYVLVDAGGPGMSSVGPAVFLAAEDLPSDPETDTAATVTIDAIEYSIHTVKPDGLGGLHLLLHRTS